MLFEFYVFGYDYPLVIMQIHNTGLETIETNWAMELLNVHVCDEYVAIRSNGSAIF